MTSPRLLILAPAPVIETPEGVLLDIKFYEGMKRHCNLWPGPVTCLLRTGATHIEYNVRRAREELGFELRTVGSEDEIGLDDISEQDLVMCSADDHTNLHISSLAKGTGIKTVYVIEYTLETRLQIAWLEPDTSMFKRLKSIAWNLLQERRRISALRACDALQSNGAPGFLAYQDKVPGGLTYFDNRMTPDLFCSDAQMQARRERLRRGEALRLVFSGRLEPMKGAQDLVPIVARLRDLGIKVTLDIFGAGRLRDSIRDEISTRGLTECITLHDPVDFSSELVPWQITNADVYLCCHKQSDPSCTYLESMGCGLAIAGYDNKMWADLAPRSGAGWTVKMNDISAMAQRLAELDQDRETVVQACADALKFAQTHDFETEFARRMVHLQSLV